MLSSEQIKIIKMHGALHFKLEGIFDASLAMQLLNLMRSVCEQTSSIYINTNSLFYFEPLGLNIFRYNLGSLRDKSYRFIFTGKNASIFMNAWPAESCPVIIDEADTDCVPSYF